MMRRSTLTALLGALTLLAAADGCTDDDAGGDPAGAGCPDDLAYFESNVWAPILSVQCIGCHSSEGPAKGTRMVLRGPGEEGNLEADFETVKAVAGLDVGGTSLLLLKPSGRHQDGHTGGELLKVGGTGYSALSRLVGRVTGAPGACDADPAAACGEITPGRRQLRRLTRVEYDNTIKDLLGIESQWGASFVSEDVVNGFDNNASALAVAPLLADQIRKAAEEIAEIAGLDLGSRLPCDPAAIGEPECAGEFIQAFGERAFRRPLDQGDVDRYQALYDLAATDEGFAGGVTLVITGMLQSPHFLYRSELGVATEGGLHALTPDEIATELSYFFWGSMPDEELRAAARSGGLGSPELIAAQARRLMESPRSRPALDHFMGQWLEIDRLAVVPKDDVALPGLTAPVRAAMREETSRLVAHVVHEGSGRLPELFSAGYSFVNDDLAAFYGLSPSGPADPAGWRRVEQPGPSYAGILTQGSVMATHALPNASSPIRRGKLVREKLFCQSLPPPPPGLNAQPPPIDPALTTRERFAAHAAEQPCVSCHRLIDPIGFGLEHFDGAGRYRELDEGLPIDTSGEIVSTAGTDATFNGAAELGEVLAGSPDVEACFALQWVRFAYGIEEDESLSCLVEGVTKGFTDSDLRIPDLLVALTQTPHFTMRRSDEDTTEPPTGDPPAGDPPTGDPPTGDPPTGDPPATEEVMVAVVTESQWATGHCDKVTVTNTSQAPVDWVITLQVTGTINQVWDATHVPAGDEDTFSGVGWNDVLDPGASATFGYCAES